MTIFDTLIDSFTNGLITDVQTLVLALLSIAFLVAALDLLSSHMYGFSPVDKISDYKKELEYRDFKRGLDKQAEFNRRYLCPASVGNGLSSRLI